MESTAGLVKWVQKYSLRDGPQPIETGPVTFIPVIPLADLTEVVELLKSCRFGFQTFLPGSKFVAKEALKRIDAMLTQLEAQGKKG